MNMFTSLIMRKSNQQKLAKTLTITTPNGINEERFVKIGGINQWLSIRGEDRNNPILFFIHGGPGSTYTIFTPLLRSWEKYFTIVQWDQRGSGKTLRHTDLTAPLTFEHLIQDGIAIVEFLRTHLGHQKVILIGSSAGSIPGIAMAKRRPDLFWAYVGTDQNTGDQAQALSYQLTLEGLQASGNTKGVKAVKKISPDHTKRTRKDFDTLNQWTIKANPTVPHMVTDIILPAMLTSPSHTLHDLMDILKGMNFSTDQLFFKAARITDIRDIATDFAIPIFILQGDTDAVTPTASAKAYFDEIKAPHKEFVLIKQAGHLALFAQPEQALQELLQRVRPLAIKHT